MSDNTPTTSSKNRPAPPGPTTSPAHTEPSPSTSKRRRGALATLALVGPAFVVGAWQFGPGNLASAVQAGSRYGYTLIWVIALSTILMIAFTDMAVRLGIRVPVSLLTSIKGELGKPIGVAAGIGVFFITLMFSVGNAVGSGLGLSIIFGGSPVLWTVICTIAVASLLLARNVYRLIEKVLVAIVALMAIAFIGSVIISKPDWAASVTGLVVPSFPPGATILIVALIGTNFSINAAFYTAYGTKERKRSADDYHTVTLVDTVPGIVAPGIMTILVIITAAAVLGGSGQEAATIAQLARVFEPLAGRVGELLFALGLSGAAFSSMIANATAGGQMFTDGVGKGGTASTRTARLTSAVILAFGVTVTLLFQSSPVGLIVLAQSLTVLVAPLLGVLLYIMSNRKSVMGSLTNRWWINLLGGIGLVAIVASSIRLITTLL